MPKEIIDMKIEEVSAVDKAATRKKFLLIKREKDEDVKSKEYTMEELINKLTASVKKELSDEGGENMPELKDILEKIEDEDVRKSVEEFVASLEKEEEKPEEEPIDKSEMPEELRKRFEDLEKKAAMAEEIAKKEREMRLEIEFSKRAKEFSDVGEVEKIASILKRVSDDEDLQSDVEEVLKSAQERLVNADLFKEKGGNGEDVTDAEATIEKKTKELMKSDTSLTFAKAQRKVLEENPDLYKEYSSQRG